MEVNTLITEALNARAEYVYSLGLTEEPDFVIGLDELESLQFIAEFNELNSMQRKLYKTAYELQELANGGV